MVDPLEGDETATGGVAFVASTPAGCPVGGGGDWGGGDWGGGDGRTTERTLAQKPRASARGFGEPYLVG